MVDLVASGSVYEALRATVARDPDKTAIICDDERVAYTELLRHVDNAARRLSGHGIAHGDRFAAFSQNRPDIMFCYYAAAKLGATFVPLNPNLTSTEVEYAVRHSGSRLLLHDEAGAETAKKLACGVEAAPIQSLRQSSTLPHEDLSSPATPDDDLLIIYTSGTTGAPKAIVLDQAAQLAAADALATMWEVTADDVTLVALPLGFLYGLSTACAVGLQTGGQVVILRRFHPRDVLEGLVAHRATIFHGVPTMFSMMLDYCEQRDLTFGLSGMRELICAGAPLAAAMRRRFAERFGSDLHNYYGLTEAAPVFGKYASDPVPMPEGAAGKAAPGLQVKIVRHDGSECGLGEEGEILVRAPATLKRYLNAPEHTDAAFRNGLFRTGDLGRGDERGYFYITGRIKEVIIRGGANISPGEVEAVLAAHPAVQEAAVIGVSDHTFGEVPVAFVVARHGVAVTERDLVGHAETALSDFKVPRRFFFVSELPQGKTGKVDKVELKRRCRGLVSPD